MGRQYSWVARVSVKAMYWIYWNTKYTWTGHVAYSFNYSLNHQNTGIILAVNSIRTYMYRMSVTTLTMCSSYFSSAHTLTVFHYPCTNSYGLNVIVLTRWKESILVNNNKSCYNLNRAVWWPQCLSAHWFHLNFIWQVITLFAISFSEMMW